MRSVNAHAINDTINDTARIQVDALEERSVDYGHENSTRSVRLPWGRPTDDRVGRAPGPRGARVADRRPPDYVAAAERCRPRYHGYGHSVENFLAATAGGLCRRREAPTAR
jgi:hypothetical protein